MRLIMFLAVTFVAMTDSARAGVISSNFGPADSFHTDSGAPVDQKPSISFTSAVDQALNEVDFAVSLRSAGSVNQLTVRLSGDTGGHPGTSVGTGTFDGLLSLTPGILQWIPVTQLALSAGTTYWISLEAPQNNVIWNYNDQLASGDSRFISNVWTVQAADTQGALRIIGSDVTATPEPGTWVLLASGIVAAAGARRRREN
jgi:hypothetical protein